MAGHTSDGILGYGVQCTSDFIYFALRGCPLALLQVSKQSYNQGVCAEYKRDTRKVRNVLANARGTSSGDMYNLVTGATIIRIIEVEETTTVTLKWYQSQIPVQSKQALFQATSLSSNLAVTKVNHLFIISNKS